MKITALENKLQDGSVVIMDGATGTEIQRRGVKTNLPLWSASALLSNPEVVRQIHLDYVKAGAEIITANTFSTTERNLNKVGIKGRARELTVLACELAREAVELSGKSDVYIAGSMAPLEDCYSPNLTPSDDDLKKEHEAYAADLAAGNVDFILIETMITLRETRCAIEAAQKTGLPFAVSFCTNEQDNLLGGASLKTAVMLIEEYKPLFIGVNCVSPKIVDKQIDLMVGVTDLPLSAYAHGNGKPSEIMGWEFDSSDTGKDYLSYAKKWVETGAQVIGGCCGTTPQYIQTLSKLA